MNRVLLCLMLVLSLSSSYSAFAGSMNVTETLVPAGPGQKLGPQFIQEYFMGMVKSIRLTKEILDSQPIVSGRNASEQFMAGQMFGEGSSKGSDDEIDVKIDKSNYKTLRVTLAKMLGFDPGIFAGLGDDEIFDKIDHIDLSLKKYGPGEMDYIIGVKLYTKESKFVSVTGKDLSDVPVLRKIDIAPETFYTIKLETTNLPIPAIKIAADTWRSEHALRFETKDALKMGPLAFNRFWANEIRVHVEVPEDTGMPVLKVRVNIGWNGNLATVNIDAKVDSETEQAKIQLDLASAIRDNLPKMLILPLALFLFH